MKRGLIFLLLFLAQIGVSDALEVKHQMETSIGVFDAVHNTFSYALRDGKHYDIQTSLKTQGTFGVLYPFQAMYHAVGTYQGLDFKPQDYFYQTKSAFNERTKEIFYKNGVPQYRESSKNGKKKRVDIVVDPQYPSSIDLLSVLGIMVQKVILTGKCDMEQYSFNGKKYAKSLAETVKKEKIDTGYFKGKALKCKYSLEIVEDTDAGFLVNSEEPIYFWILKDDKSKAYFVAKIAIESTPFGKLQTLTTQIEVKNE